MKNCLIVNDVEYTFKEVSDFVYANFKDSQEEWYNSVNSMVIDCFDDIVKLIARSNRPTAIEDWILAVTTGATVDSYEDWKAR
jgi:hypothetical protein